MLIAIRADANLALRLSDGIKQRIFHAAVADNVAPAGHRGEVFGQAKPRLLNAALAAGDGQHIRLEPRIGLEEALFDHRGGQFTGFESLRKTGGRVTLS